MGGAARPLLALTAGLLGPRVGLDTPLRGYSTSMILRVLDDSSTSRKHMLIE
ncbi:hypothetical protein [Rathayibacter sp. VKM Ac-2856]|uniref:hypothetical protein n=1 Tax=Rathayibacter sp. VKM Ac-2856 TaxID=2739021 RepID=UPI001C20B915|nr:hypothetical protein [Rathayibacter sp. VKM Ac-2856]